MSIHYICFHGEIRKIFSRYPLLSRGLLSVIILSLPVALFVSLIPAFVTKGHNCYENFKLHKIVLLQTKIDSEDKLGFHQNCNSKTLMNILNIVCECVCVCGGGGGGGGV